MTELHPNKHVEMLAELRSMAPPTRHHRRDPEKDHLRADAILCEALVLLGYEDLVEAFRKIDKWYA